MPAKPKFTISHALVCDDFRTENNGKGLIIGVYSSTIGFSKPPEAFRFCVCLLGTASQAFGVNIKAEFVPDNGGKKSEFNIGADIARAQPDAGDQADLFIPVKDIVLPMGGEGTIVIRTREKGAKRWKKVSETRIEVNPNHPILQRQLS